MIGSSFGGDLLMVNLDVLSLSLTLVCTIYHK